MSGEMEIIRRKLRELKDRVSKIDRLDMQENRVKALEDKLARKR